jgi:hypothetical protein
VYIALANRLSLLPLLPTAGMVAEIGVAEGIFSAQILARNSPSRLHLIDPWVHQDLESYRKDGNNVGNEEAERRYRAVVEKFRVPSATGQVAIHRALSQDIGPEFSDGYFDWVYIDGMHSHDAVLTDLRTFAPKVESDGFILGHDFTNCQPALDIGFGVVEAVLEFIAETGYELLLLTFEPFPTYVIAKNPQGPRRARLRASALASLNLVVEIRNPLSRGFQHTLRNLDRATITLGDMTMSFD